MGKKNYTAILTLLLMLPLGNSDAASRLLSLYCESFSALQEQSQLAAHTLQEPRLMALPMMMLGLIPGGMMMDQSQPLALHLIDTGRNQMAQIVELSVKGAPDGYLQQLAGLNEALPEPIDGFYNLKGVAVRIVGQRLLLAPNPRRPELWFGSNLAQLPPMPDIPGLFRISFSPAAVESALQQAKSGLAASNDTLPIDDQLLLQETLALYSAILNQINGFYIGIDVEAGGLYLRSSLVTKAGSEMAQLARSLVPATPALLSFIDDQSLFSYVSGGVVLPAGLEQQIAALNRSNARLMAANAAVKLESVVALMEHAATLRNVPYGLTATIAGPDNALQLSGLLATTNAAALLARQLELQQSDAFRRLTHLAVETPVERSYRELAIHSADIHVDLDSLGEQLQGRESAGRAPPQAAAAVKALRSTLQQLRGKLSSRLELAALAESIALGIGAGEMVERAINAAAAASASPAAMRLKEELAPAQPLHTAGRISLAAIATLLSTTTDEAPAPVVPAGSGTTFASWGFEHEIQGILHLPTEELRSLQQLSSNARQNN